METRFCGSVTCRSKPRVITRSPSLLMHAILVLTKLRRWQSLNSFSIERPNSCVSLKSFFHLSFCPNFSPEFDILAYENKDQDLPISCYFMTSFCVMSAVGAHGVEDFVLWNLGEH